MKVARGDSFFSRLLVSLGFCWSFLPMASTFCVKVERRINSRSCHSLAHHLRQIYFSTLQRNTVQIPIRSFCLSSAGSSPERTTIGSLESIIGPELPPIDSPTKRLFLVRHGEVINPGGERPVYYGAMDVPLSKLGEEEAEAAALYLQGFDLDFVVSSPLSRAMYGAKQVHALQNALIDGDIITMDGFTELDRGSWCGKTKDEIGSETMARFDACDESVTPEGGESYPFLKQRVLKARDDVLEKLPPGRAAVIVSHLQVTRSMLSDALNIPTEEMANLKVATASVSCIDYDIKSGTQTVRFQSFKPDIGLERSKDGAN